MIRLQRPAEPEVLKTKGQTETRNLTENYDKGKRDFEFDNKIYAATSVKNSLRNAQSGKCCYCERYEEIGDVEHFRPKDNYYWLAYDWENLLFSCPKCNRSFKRTKFPLGSEYQTNNHHNDISKEIPLLINPYNENPEKHIEYKGFTPIGKDIKGKTTIETIGLDRPFLDQRRMQIYKLLKQTFQAMQNNTSKKTELENLIQEYTSESSEYSLMIRCAIKDNFKY